VWLSWAHNSMVDGSTPTISLLYNDSGQVVHTHTSSLKSMPVISARNPSLAHHKLAMTSVMLLKTSASELA